MTRALRLSAREHSEPEPVSVEEWRAIAWRRGLIANVLADEVQRLRDEIAEYRAMLGEPSE